MKVLCGDIETDGLLDSLTKMHCAVFINPENDSKHVFTNIKELEKFLNEHKDYHLAIQNGVCFDKPALIQLGINVPNKIIDTLALSYYLYLNRPKHGLESWGEDLGIPKPVIKDWSNLSQEEYIHRCTEDVRIEVLRWKTKLYPYLLDLYGNEKDVLRCINYLNWKMECQRIQENNKINLDYSGAIHLRSKFEQLIAEKVDELKKVMPPDPVYTIKTKPKVMYKLNGSISSYGEKWLNLLKEHNLPEDFSGEVRIIKEYKEPNPNSHQQVKQWLYSLGWKPETFKYVKKDKPEEEYKAELAAANGKAKKYIKPYYVDEIPQINTEDGVCPSISKLARKVPEVTALEGLGVLSHRLGIVNGFIRDARESGNSYYLQARCHGFTNTLRLKHAELVNLPSGRKPYGAELRGLLLAGEGSLVCGADLSSLEDRLKHHYQYPLDPEYVKAQLVGGYDPHITMCVKAGLLTQKQAEEPNAKETYAQIRHQGKGASYACQYGAGVPTLVKQVGIDEDTAKALHEAYWQLNWSIKAIAEATLTKTVNKQKWQYNPVSRLWYWLKKDKDRFSTLIQGTGSYIFDMWLYNVNQACLSLYNREMPLCGQWHDEGLWRIKDNEKAKEALQDVLNDAILSLNKRLKLNRDMAIDVKFGHNYYEVH